MALHQAPLEFKNSKKSQPKVKEEPKDVAEIASQQVGDNMFGKVVDFQFLVHPKQESIEVKTESETLALTGEVIDPFDEDWVALNRNVWKEQYFTQEKYFCKECNGEFPFKKHDLHLEYLKILDKAEISNTRKNNYSCKECDITFDTSQKAIKHLFEHDQTFDCRFCIYVGKTFSDLKCHIKLTHPDLLSSTSSEIIHCKECDFKATNRLTMRKHIDTKHTLITVKCKQCDEYWPDDDHTLHEKVKHITRKKITTESPFACKECDMKFVDTNKIYEHLKIHCDIGFYCNFCSFNSNKPSHLENHKQREHLDQINEKFKQKELSIKDYACIRCNRLWPDKNHESHLLMLKIEEKGVSATQPYKCLGCRKDITDIKRVYFHLRLGCKKLTCDKCFYITTRVDSMQRHKRMVHSKPDQVTQYEHFCDVCDYKTTSVNCLNVHKKKHIGESEKVYFKCDLCNFKTIHKKYVKSHKSSVHERSKNKEIITCPECPFITNSVVNLQKHRKRIHSNVFYHCPDCLYQTKIKSNFEIHRIRKHFTSEDNNKNKNVYVCELCGIKYIAKLSLTQHMIKKHNIQSGKVQKYICHTCNFETTNKHRLIPHIRFKHKKCNKMYCANCDYSTVNKTNLIQHMVKHADPSKMKMHKCTMCSFTTKRPHTLRYHIKSHDVAK